MQTAGRVAAETIPELLARKAGSAPSSPALLAPQRAPLSYQALAAHLQSTRASLRALGVAQQDRVAVVLENGPEMASAFLAVAGAAACAPLNPRYTAAEFEFYLQDLEPKLVLVREASESPVREVARAIGIGVAEVRVRDGSAAGEFTLGVAGGTARADAGAQAEDVALILHTSGTTSRPKMVPLTQRNLCVSACNIASWFALTPQDRCLNIMPLFHIHGLVGALLASLAAGASVVCTPGFSAARFFALLDEFAPTWYTAVPTMHQEILARAAGCGEIIARRRMRFIRSCSASLAPGLLEVLEKTFQAPVLESYGMTEAAHQMSSNPLPPGVRKPGSVGLPAGPEIGIMDAGGKLLASGAVGEVVIRGPNVTSGYLGNPEANRRAFTNGWFRTGDQGYLDQDGYLYLTGRLKEIINRGGETISPREIDEALLEHPAVAQAVAFAVPHSRLGEEVGAAAVLKPGASLSEGELREFVAARLSLFKVPRLIRFVEAIPKGPTGKIQRIGLAARLGIAPIEEPRRQAAAYLAPRTPVEKRLAAVWSKLLGIECIGVNDDFFACGGDSLAAAQLVPLVSKEFNVERSFVRFLEAPTIASLARQLEADPGSALQRSHLAPIRPEGSHPPLFCAAGHDEVLVGFANLARFLPPGLPVMAFESPGTAEAGILRTIEMQASRNIEAMRQVQPAGPYHLLGLCHGGLVVYEMARQLEQDGESVALLALIDAYPSQWRKNLPPLKLLSQALGHAARRSWTHLHSIAGPGGWQHLRGRIRVFLAAWKEKALVAGHRSGLRRTSQDARLANRLAQRDYRPQPYNGSVVLFRSRTARAGIYPAAVEAWRPLVRGGLEVVDVDTGFESTLAEPGASQVARELTQRLQISASNLRN